MDEITDINETNDNILNNEIIENNENYENNIIPQYELILELLGLNKNINYPLSIILDGIMEMHTTKNKDSPSYYISKRARIYKFKNDDTSKKLEYILYTSDNITTSYFNIFRNLGRIYRNYTYNKIANKISNQNNAKNNELMLGFNYHNQRWNTLSSYVIE